MNNINVQFDDNKKCINNTKFTHSEYDSLKTTIPIIANDIDKLDFNDNNTYNTKTDNIDKINLDIYKFQYKLSYSTTFNYLYNEISNGIFVKIKNNKLEQFYPFVNFNYENDFHQLLKLPKKYKNIDDFLKDFNKEFPIRKTDHHENNLKKWSASNCVFQPQRGEKPYINDQYYSQFYSMFKNLCDNRKVNDCSFFLNIKDFPRLNKKRFKGFTNIYGDKYPIDISKYYYFSYLLSQCSTDEHADLTLPTSDCWELITKKLYPSRCSNPYINIEKYHVPWNDKINTAFFRGMDTGCSFDYNINPRLKITKISKEWENNNKYNHNNPIDKIPFLDAGIVRYSRKIRVNNNILTFTNKNKLIQNNIILKDYVQMENQLKFKYIIYIEGNSAAYRLGSLLSTKSTILKVESKYYLWFEKQLEPYKHYVPIKHDLSDLDEKIIWCKNNDNKCKEIANNAYQFYKKTFNYDNVYNYLQNLINSMSNNNINVEQINKEFIEYKKNRTIMEKIKTNFNNNFVKTAIIVPFRDNKLQNRKEQLDKFISFWNKQKDFNIYIVIQPNDNNKFNRGQLLNIGAKYAIDDKCQNLIFHDVDLLPDNNLIKYYKSKFNEPLHLASNWDKYTHFTFFGGVTAVNKNIFIKSNGFPNNFFGWGGEDDVFYNRIAKFNKNILIPNNGKFNEMKHKNTSEIPSSTLFNEIKKHLIINDNNIGFKEINTDKTKIEIKDNITYIKSKIYTNY